MAIQKSQIVQTALNVLDRDGLEGVTLRRLATELNIKAASIYWHVASKGALLDEMANAILEAHFDIFDFTNDQLDWDEWLYTFAHELRAAMLARREGARVVAGAHPDVAFMLTKLWDLTVRILHNSGFTDSQCADITMTVTHFTFGSVIEEQSSPPITAAPERSVDDMQRFVRSFPIYAQAMKTWHAEDNDTHFDTAMRILINGVRAEKQGDKSSS